MSIKDMFDKVVGVIINSPAEVDDKEFEEYKNELSEEQVKILEAGLNLNDKQHKELSSFEVAIKPEKKQVQYAHINKSEIVLGKENTKNKDEVERDL